MYISIKNQMEKNLTDSNISTEFSPDDVVGRCYKGKEKSGRVRHMGFSKTHSIYFVGVVRVQTLVVPLTVEVHDPMFRQFATLMLKEMKRQAGTLSPKLQVRVGTMRTEPHHTAIMEKSAPK
ncbi:hypothetical protein LINGRAHAP2_LOCUS8083 [Linum grandiflorum]